MNDLNFDGLTDAQLRIFAVLCARRVQHLMTKPRSIAVLDVAERHAKGEATDDELSAAWNASAAGAAAAAVAAVGAAATWSITAAATNTAAVAAWELAWVAEREAQQKILDEIK